jgi:hypothetical protein
MQRCTPYLILIQLHVRYTCTMKLTITQKWFLKCLPSLSNNTNAVIKKMMKKNINYESAIWELVTSITTEIVYGL